MGTPALSVTLFEAESQLGGLLRTKRQDGFLIEHSADNFIYDPDYLGIHRTSDLIMVQIFFNEGRSVAQKQALYKAIAEGLSEQLGVRLEDVFITLVEVKKENWSFGNGIAQYA